MKAGSTPRTNHSPSQVTYKHTNLESNSLKMHIFGLLRELESWTDTRVISSTYQHCKERITSSLKQRLCRCMQLNSTFGSLSWNTFVSAITTLCLLFPTTLRAPACALQPFAWLLGPGFASPYEEAVGWTRGKAYRETHTQIWPKQPTLPRQQAWEQRGKRQPSRWFCRCIRREM